MRGPGNAQGYYRGDTFYYRAKCRTLVRRSPEGEDQARVVCGWAGYRVWPRASSCPRCGGCLA